MTAYLLRRVVWGITTIFAVTTLTFVLVHAAPGEPFGYGMDDARLTPQARAVFRARYRLDDPVPVQYVSYMSRLLRGDLGESLSARRPVATVLMERLPRTLLLMATAILGGFALGMALGAWQASRLGSRWDKAIEVITVGLGSLPDFWIAIFLLLTFGLQLRWFPVTGMVDVGVHDFLPLGGRLRDIAWHLVLPASSLLLIVVGVVARFQRAAVLEVLPEDYVRTARAKGVRPHGVLYRHALRNALLPSITLLGLSLPALVGGAVFVEAVFSWPGLGLLAIDAMRQRDYSVVLGVSLITSVLVVMAGILTDLAYAAADPRTRRG